MRSIIVGMLAHVDSGKTTLSEAMLYTSGSLRQLGRVDQGTTFLDYDPQERERGITIYAKEAFFTWNDEEITLLDTPGHVDFSSEMERTLQVLDAAVLIISATAGVQAHTETIWKLLSHYDIPVFLFVNKMDIAYEDSDVCLRHIQDVLHAHCLDFTMEKAALDEEIAMGSDALLEAYMEQGCIEDALICEAVMRKQVVPCYFGSALRLQGVKELLDGICRYTKEKQYGEEFAAQVYKISHDTQGNRLTHLKLNGGVLQAKQVIEGEKIDQIRRYHGNRYEVVGELSKGHVCAIKGWSHIQAGALLGEEQAAQTELLSSAMMYQMKPPEGMDALTLMKRIAPLIDEDPSLRIHYDRGLHEVQLQLRGDVQKEVLRRLIQDRFALEVQFCEGRIAYRESICALSEGVGHYEPLRHYAEVHVRLEPLPLNSGLQIDSSCPLEMADAPTQRTILTYLQGEDLIGVLSGSPLTDMRITLTAVKGHEKHTSGGDYREAARRAVRQGCMMNQSVLLEPMVQFSIRIPHAVISRIMYDLEQAQAEELLTQEQGMLTIITGKAAMRFMQSYANKVQADTKGKGSFQMQSCGYGKVKHPERILHEIGYEEQRDVEHPTGSIFCMHGAGVYVPWDQVYAHMHLPFTLETTATRAYPKQVHRQIHMDEEELKRVTQPLHASRKKWKKEDEKVVVEGKDKQSNPINPPAQKQPCLIVDGYNMIFSWPNLSEMAKHSVDQARSALLAMLGSYQGYRRCALIVVFDAYRSPQKKEHVFKDHNLYVVYTKNAQTADSYIEKTTHMLASQYHMTVATSDAQEQNIILGVGANRMSALELYEEMQRVHHQAMDAQRLQPQFRHMALSELRKWKEEEE